MNVRPWNRRRDRGALERWPLSADPFAALWAHAPGDLAETRRSWAIDQGGELAGRITLRDEDPRLRVARLGIYLRPDLVGRGIGSAALWQFLDLAFGELGLVQIRLDVVAANTRAVRCYTRLGFVRQHMQWCDIPPDPALALLSAPSHEHLRPFFRLLCDPPQALYFELYHLAAWWQMIRRSDAPAHTLARRPGAGTAGRVVLQPDAAFLEA